MEIKVGQMDLNGEVALEMDLFAKEERETM